MVGCLGLRDDSVVCWCTVGCCFCLFDCFGFDIFVGIIVIVWLFAYVRCLFDVFVFDLAWCDFTYCLGCWLLVDSAILSLWFWLCCFDYRCLYVWLVLVVEVVTLFGCLV